MGKFMFLNSKVAGSPLSLLEGWTHFGSQENVKKGFFSHVKISFLEAKFRKLGHKISLNGGGALLKKRIKVGGGGT